MRTLICLALIAVASHSASASVLSFVKNSVYKLDNTNKVAAVLNDKLESNTKVGTGEKSMCELSFDDKSVTRIGENSEFSFIEQERLIKCGDGKFLVSKDPDTEPITVTAGGVTAAIAGSTVLFDVKGGIAHIAVIETTKGVAVTDKDGKTVTLQSGEGISAAPSGMTSTQPRPVDVKEMTASSPLFTEQGLAPLANDALIKGVASAQESAKATAGMSFTSEINDVVSGKIDSATALAKTGGIDIPDMDTAAGVETAAGNNNSTPPSTPANPQLVPPINSSPYPPAATPI
jgi:hypothetical protein